MKAKPRIYPTLFNRLKTAVKREIKRNYIFVHKKKFRTNVGRAYPAGKTNSFEAAIKIPIITDIESIYVIFHEIAHVQLNHVNNHRKLNYIQEMEAEQYALRYLRKFSIHKLFPEDYCAIFEKAICYVIQNIYYDIEKGLKYRQINKKVLAFCRQKPIIEAKIASKKRNKKKKSK